jgi:hypothetical protein
LWLLFKEASRKAKDNGALFYKVPILSLKIRNLPHCFANMIKDKREEGGRKRKKEKKKPANFLERRSRESRGSRAG